jgi:hypothetical protein
MLNTMYEYMAVNVDLVFDQKQALGAPPNALFDPAVTQLLNAQAQEGWEFVSSAVMPWTNPVFGACAQVIFRRHLR